MSNLESWKSQQLIDWLEQNYNPINQEKEESNTRAIREVFLKALSDIDLIDYRPDSIWTALQNTYYLRHSHDALKKFIEEGIKLSQEINDPDAIVETILTKGSGADLINDINGVRDSWVRSSGVGLEQVLVECYRNRLVQENPPVHIVTKASLNNPPYKGNILNVGKDDIGSSNEDDIYVLTANANNQLQVYGVIQVKASGGDRSSQAYTRSRVLLEAGYLSIYFTLDPMEINRSPYGMLVNKQYVNSINLTKGNSMEPGFHAVYVGRNSDGRRPLISSATPVPINRIIDIDMRNPDNAFVRDLVRARNDWLNNGYKLPRNWS